MTIRGSHNLSRLLLLLVVALSCGGVSWALDCPVGSSTLIVIPESQINDNYCDCPSNGIDEPATSACAGSQHWPGMIGVAGEEFDPTYFACPQQPQLVLPPSKVGDGICDCCDGADETIGGCPDNCEVVLREERERRVAWQAAYQAGSQQRQVDLQAYASLVSESTQKLALRKEELTTLSGLATQQSQVLQSHKQSWIQSRLDAYAARVKALWKEGATATLPDLRDFLDPLTVPELQALLVHACQLAGEMPDAASKTCVPLRLAGLAVGVAWEPQTYKMVRVVQDRTLSAWANVVHGNIENPESPQWYVAKEENNDDNDDDTKERRRLDEYLEEEEDFDPYEEEDYGRYDGDDDEEEERMLQQYQARQHQRTNQQEREEGNSKQRETEMAWVKEQAFSVPRIRFLERTDILLERLDALTTNDDDDGDEESGEKKTVPEGFDPMAAPLLRTQIQRRRDAIEKGMDYAVSARVLLQNVQDRDILESLVYGVWYYGRLSAWHMWQVYHGVVPELGGTVADAQTCKAVWACPPMAATRKVGGEQIMIPPAFFVQVADEYCRRMSDKEIDAATVCAADDGTGIPSEIADGMLGYFAAETRSVDDAAGVLFQGLQWEENESDEYAMVKSLLATKQDLDDKIRDVERDIKNIEDVLGQNKDGSNKYGPDGELYSIRDSCFEITAGKYVYELCMFKSAKQKEGTASHGTDLGKWSGTLVTEDGQRVWSWENGAKCWNGPQRSAWAYLTCGATTKIISANEPETCKYVFEVESHIACDEAYGIQNNLLS